MASKPLRLVSPRLSKRITQDSPICFIPDSLLLEIFTWLDPQALVRAAAVYTRWRQVALDRSLWRNVDLSSYRLSALALRKVFRARLSRDLRELRLSGHARARSVFQRGALAKSTRALLTPAFVQELRDRCVYLTSLRLFECDLRGLLLSQFPERLQQLTLNNCMLSLRWFSMAKVLPRVEYLDVSYCSIVNDYDLRSIAQHLPLLKTIALRGCYRVTADGIRALVEKRRGLKRMDLAELQCNGDLVMHHICLFAVDVEDLNLSSCSISDGSLTLIGKSLSNLKRLCLYRCRGISRIGVLSMLASLAAYGKICRIDLGECTGVKLSAQELTAVLPEQCACVLP